MSVNPVTEKLKKHVVQELKVYSNLAPQVALFMISTTFLGYMIFNLVSKNSMDVNLVDIVVKGTGIGIVFGVFGFIIGKLASERLQRAQLMRLQKERKKRRDSLKDKLREKETVLKKLEEYTL